MAGLAMVFDVIARDHASKTFKDIAGSAEHSGKKISEAGDHGSRFGSVMGKGLKVAAIGLAAAGTAAVVFGKQSVDAFEGNTKSAMAMQRAIGGSIEDASRLNFVARESGVSQEVFAKSIKLLEKNITEVAGKAGPGAKALASIGVSAKDAHGNMRPMAQLLPDIADKFAKMPNGPEKTALALKLFGRAGTDMLPMLNRGKTGIADLMAESDKFGLTVGQKNVDDMKKNIKQQREWHAMLDGVKVQIGSALLPILTALAGEMHGRLTPAIQGATKFLMDNKDTIAAVTATLIRFLPQIAIGIGLIKTLTTVTKLFSSTMSLVGLLTNPVGLVIAAIALLAIGLKYAWDHSETFRKVATTAFEAIQNAAAWMWNHVIAPVIRFLINGFSTVTTWIGNMLDALSHIPGFGWAKDLADKLHTASTKAQGLAKDIKDIPTSHNTTLKVDSSQAVATIKKVTSQIFSAVAHISVGGQVAEASLTGGGPGAGFLKPVPGNPGFPWGRYPSGAIHRALDFPVPIGTPIRSGENAHVMVSGWDTTGFGNAIRTHDADGNYTIYGHMSRLVSKVGQNVYRGQIIGYSGSTGNSTGPHVHVERRHILYDPSTSFNFTSQLQAHAAGVVNKAMSGWALVGERGPELAFIPQGSTIYPEDRTRGILNRVASTPGDGRSTLVRIAPEDLAAIEQAAYEGTLRGARVGAEMGTADGSYRGTRDGAAEGVSRAADGARRAARAAAGTRGG